MVGLVLIGEAVAQLSTHLRYFGRGEADVLGFVQGDGDGAEIGQEARAIARVAAGPGQCRYPLEDDLQILPAAVPGQMPDNLRKLMALETEVNASCFSPDSDSAMRIFAGPFAASEAISLGKESE